MVEEERSTGAPDADPVEVGVENLSVEKIESPGPALFGDLLWNALFLPDSTKCLEIILIYYTLEINCLHSFMLMQIEYYQNHTARFHSFYSMKNSG